MFIQSMEILEWQDFYLLKIDIERVTFEVV